MQLLMSLVGMAVLILIAVLFSSDRRAIKLRTVVGAFIIQVLIGALVLYWEPGRDVLISISNGVTNVIGYGQEGMSFIFGVLVSDKMDLVFGKNNGFIFALRVLPVIVFFSSLIAVLYYLGIMQFVIKILGGGLQKVLGTSRTESMSATANIFVGQTEAPLVVRPYIAGMTNSELFAVMCGGLASVAGSVLAGYHAMGVPMPYLLAASFMAAPGGLLFAKLMVPETEGFDDKAEATLESEEERPANIIDAAAGGASAGMQLALNVGAMLLAFIALIALLNGILSGIGGWFDYPQLSMELILGWLFSPIAFLIGVPWSEAMTAGSFIGQKVVVNEFVAYMHFSEYLKPDAQVIAAGLQPLSDHTKAIISFALCGFANLSSVAILLGGLGGMAPTRRKDVARLGMKAVMAGTLSNLMSATIAGFFLAL